MAKSGNCEDCKKQSDNLNLHHKDRNHKNNNPANLKYLCPRCHGLEHGYEGIEESSFRFGDAYEVMTNKAKVGYRLSEGFGLLNAYKEE